MAQIRKTERNKAIVKMRQGEAPISYPKIAKMLKMHQSQVHKIYKRDKELYKGER